MLKKLFTAMLVASLSLGAFATQAYADHEHDVHGYIMGFVDEGDTGAFHFTLKECDGTLHTFHFKDHSNRGVLRSSINRYIDSGDFVRVKDDNQFVGAMQNVPGGNCDNLQLILDALAHDDGEDFEEDFDEDLDEDLEEILEVYEDADHLEDGEVLAPPPPSDRPERMRDRMEHRMDHDGEMRMKYELRKKQKHRLSDERKQEVGSRVRDNLRREIREDLEDDGRVSKRHLKQLRERMKKRMRFENSDDRAERLEEEAGFQHINPVKLRRLKTESIATMHPITMKGKYVAKEGHSFIINPRQHVLAELDFGGKQDAYEEFIGQRVVVKGEALRSSKVIHVDGMKLLEGQPEENTPLDKWRVGASLYQDVDTADEGIWYTKHLGLLYDRGIFGGYEDGTFGAANPVTIGEISKVVSEAARHELDQDEDFEELLEGHRGHWSKRYIRHMKRHRFIDNLDNPDRPATRKEVIRAILKAYGLDELDMENLPEAFPDTDDEFIRKAYELGIVGGYDDGTFRPNANINRAEVAKIITLAIEMLEEDDGSLEELEDIFDEIEDLEDEELEEWLDQ